MIIVYYHVKLVLTHTQTLHCIRSFCYLYL